METVQKYEHKLPSIRDIYSDIQTVTNNTALAVILNAEPPKEWVKVHPTTHQNYIPIERVEYLLTRIFGKWRVEVKSSSLKANSIEVVIRLHYIDPITNEWDWQDGIGASPLQTNQGAGATDFNQLKNDAVQIASPAAETYAVKDAAEKLGKIFGKDLNRRDVIDYKNLNDINANRFKTLDE